MYEPEEVTALLTAAQAEPFHWRIFITLAIVAGVRRGENLGIEWPMVNFATGTVDVSQSIVKAITGAVIKSPKSKVPEGLSRSLRPLWKNYGSIAFNG